MSLTVFEIFFVKKTLFDKSLLGARAFKNVEIDKKFVSIGNWDSPLDSTVAVFFRGGGCLIFFVFFKKKCHSSETFIKSLNEHEINIGRSRIHLLFKINK